MEVNPQGRLGDPPFGAPQGIGVAERTRTFSRVSILIVSGKKAPFRTDPIDGIKSVAVTLLRLSNIARGFERLTIEVDQDQQTDIYAASARWFGDSDPLRRPEWRVSQAKLRINFHPEGKGKRAKTINVELRAPNGSNLKDQTRRHQIVSEKYLARWGLIKKTMAAVA
jgi:hypothetical protein